MNVNERIASVAAAQGVVAVYQHGSLESLGGGLDAINVVWWTTAGDVSKRHGGRLIIVHYDTEQESATWAGELPEVLKAAPAPTGYITARNTPFTRAQVEAFANAQWRGQSAEYTSAPDILGFEVDNLDGKSVQVSGLFWMADGTRSDRRYVIRMVDANGLTSGANVKFERIL